jgi:dTDP-4-amino-4,6-dideoxygalactose transaminase
LAQQQRRIHLGLDRRIGKVLDRGRHVLGTEIAELETRLAAFAGCRHAIVRLSLNARLDTMQAATLLSKLRIFEDEIRLHRSVAQR